VDPVHVTNTARRWTLTPFASAQSALTPTPILLALLGNALGPSCCDAGVVAVTSFLLARTQTRVLVLSNVGLISAKPFRAELVAGKNGRCQQTLRLDRDRHGKFDRRALLASLQWPVGRSREAQGKPYWVRVGVTAIAFLRFKRHVKAGAMKTGRATTGDPTRTRGRETYFLASQ
jgi:hypothetical protein